MLEEEPDPNAQGSERVEIVEADSDPAVDAEGLPRDRDVVFSVRATDAVAQRAVGDVDTQHRLDVILDLGRALGTTLELPVLLQVVVNRITEVLPVEQVALLMVDPEPAPSSASYEFRDERQTDGRLRIGTTWSPARCASIVTHQ